MIQLTRIVGAACLVLSLQGYPCLTGADASIEVRVVDDTGKVVPDAHVVVGWSTPRPHGNGPGVGPGVGVTANTDSDGIVRLSVQGIPSVEVSKPGYYQNGIDGMDEMAKYFTNPDFPSNNVKVAVALSRVIRPVPMYVRNVIIKIPSLDGKECGFDLEAGDWVPPFGKGVFSDFKFSFIYVESEPGDWNLNGMIRFGSPDDGIIRMAITKENIRNKLRLPAVAPLNGYENKLELSCYSHRGENRLRSLRADPAFLPGTIRLDAVSWDKYDNYIFRIRSKKNDTDGLVMALYGKIHGPVSVSKDGSELLFRYYLNPDGTTGLEWDMKNNLAKVDGVPLEP